MALNETNPAPLDETRYWEAVQNRDRHYDGVFFYGVLTTGVYCRPGCPARAPKRQNVRFYRTQAEAEKQGLRPCLRCRPEGPLPADVQAARIRDLCRYMEQHADEPLTLAHLGREAGLSPFHLQRTFKNIVGVSPRQYLEGCRVRNFKSVLRDGTSRGVTEAIYDSGFGSLSRLYEKADIRLGMTPMEYRAGGRGLEITYGASKTPLGLMMVGATDRGLCFVQFGEDVEALYQALAMEYPEARVRPIPDPPPAEFAQWMDALNRHLSGQCPDLPLPLHVRATAFQMKVWRYLQSIPYGSVQSYREVAKGLGEPRAARAVARACASNRIALAIPCHRVIRGTGELGGYRWGLERKRVLLDNERKARASAR